MDEKQPEQPTAAPEAEPAPEHKRVMPLHLLGSPVLRQKAGALPAINGVVAINDQIRELAEIMVNTMHHVNGVGLAAPQVGVALRVFVMLHRADNRVLRLANPEVNEREGFQEFEEGCLSQPMLTVKMNRPKYMAVNAIDIETGNPVIVEGTDLEAAILAHEMDHLDGRLICDALSRLKRDMYKKKLAKKIKQHDRAERAKAQMIANAVRVRDERDHPHFHEPHK